MSEMGSKLKQYKRLNNFQYSSLGSSIYVHIHTHIYIYIYVCI